jgi:excisionase family DNA binding protein
MPTDANSQDPLLVTPQRAAEHLGVSREYVYRLCSAGRLRSVVLEGSRARRILYSSLVEFVESQPSEPNVA